MSGPITSPLTRRALLGLTAAAAGALATGCSGGKNSGSATEGAVRVGWYGGDPVHAAMKKALDAYHGKHSGVTISTEFSPFDGYWDKLATQTAGRNAPDVYRMSMSYFADYADRGALLDLSDQLGSAIKTADLDADVAASGKIDDGTYGVGQSSISHAVFSRPAAWQKVGAEVSTADWTWESFAEAAKGYAGEAGKGMYGTPDVGGNIQIFEPYVRQRGREIFTPDGAGLAVQTEDLEEWFAYWQDLRSSKAAPPSSITAETGDFATSLLATGKSPLSFGWVQQITFYAPLVDDPLEVAALPSPEAGSLSGQFLKALDFWVVSSTSKNQQGALALVDYLINDPGAIKTLGLTLGVPPSKAGRDQLGSDPDSPEGKAIAYVEKIKDKVGKPPAAWPKGYGEIQELFGKLNEDVGFGKSDPAKAAAQFMTEAKQSLNG
ncbi:ABC transporter substrate-binding protein [Microlunatus soli]|uniref:Carbohydrate ABC transporter substrate-binding protein, CUT1 family n=1 Tax=Microlunatus soli TaxID=630515 RepID=A0A1H1ZRZ7_9ACTN|nr:extracellular solute-binding protein [Microlunatus soli]SDT36488.1 carbohydrate ABC transporter substrate-binding protein, CUT1 family [Microlunatus soli]